MSGREGHCPSDKDRLSLCESHAADKNPHQLRELKEQDAASLTSLGIICFVIWNGSNLRRPAGVQRVGWFGLLFFGGLGVLALVQTRLTPRGNGRRLVATFRALLLAFCCLHLSHHAREFGDPDNLLVSPAVIRVGHRFGFVASSSVALFYFIHRVAGR